MPKANLPAVHSRSPQKDRAFWFFQHVSFPMRDASPVEIENFWAGQSRVDAAHHWDCCGPFNIAGRVTALVIHPSDPKTWFAGSATGGVWVTHDAGQSWLPTWSSFANQNIGALAWTQFNGKLTLVAATGEANMSGDSYPGSGVYFSADVGLTWQPLFGPAPGQTSTIDQDVRIFPRRIGAIDFQGEAMAFGSVYLDDSLPAGLYLFDPRNGGDGLVPCQFWGRRSYNCHSVLFHPRDAGTIFASIEPDGSLNGIWRSRDLGKTWEHLTRGLPSGDQFRRTSLAFAPSDPNVMYALAANRANYVLGLFRSTDGGNSWREILGGRYPTERQMSYNNALAVHPRNPESVVWGGMKLYRTDDAGRHWRRITNINRGKQDYVHGDHHVLLWPEDDLILSGNDGGVSCSRDGGRRWQECSRNMSTAMFYDIDVAPSSGKVFGGGTQDNGTLIAGVPATRPGDFVPAIPGDGAWIVFDPADAEHVFACSSGFRVYRHVRGDPWTYAHWKQVPPRRISKQESTQRSLTVLAIQPSTRSGIKTIWAGSQRLWRTDNDGRNWKVASPSFDGSPISAIEISRLTPRLMFAGTTSGGIFRSHDGGASWSQNLAGSDIPARAITSILTHPKEPATLAVTVASTGVLSSGVQLATGNALPYGHVFRSRDRGETWEDLDAGRLPNVAYYAAAYQTADPYQLFVAGDVGVWAFVDSAWVNINGNLPNVVVSDLVYHAKEATLTAATYGRGVWRMTPGVIRVPSQSPAPPPEPVPLASGLRENPAVSAPLILSPEDGAQMATRSTLIAVQPVPGAMGYQAEFSFAGLAGISASSTTPQIPFDSPASGPARWRVWAILPDGLRTAPTPWRTLTYA